MGIRGAENGGPTCGADAFRNDSFSNDCTIRTNTLNQSAVSAAHDVDPAPGAGEMLAVEREQRDRQHDASTRPDRQAGVKP